MIDGWVAILTALGYLCALFGIAHFGDTTGRRFVGERARPAIYALTLAVYCTSWTFFGSVGLASNHGLDFLPIYIGPVLVIGLGYPLVLRVVRLAKGQNITSVADFVAARYGKSEQIAALVAIIAVIGSVPYIALQLKAISTSMATVLNSFEEGHRIINRSTALTLAIVVSTVLAGFAMAFGTRRIDATEHNDGLVLAIASESLVKLVTFLIVGVFVVWYVFDGLGDLAVKAINDDSLRAMLSQPPDWSTWICTTLLSAFVILLLPRQFHVTVVENRDERDVRTAAWLFPLYLVAINLFVIPLAVAGRLMFSDGAVDRDMTVLALPLEVNADWTALIALIGGLSAATAMVIVESVALSIMISNDLVMPVLLRWQGVRQVVERANPASLILVVRRAGIIILLALGYSYFRAAGDAALASIGLLSFAAVAQIAPAFFGGLIWDRANARGAVAGLVVGITVWAYTLLIPSLDSSIAFVTTLISDGPFGITWLRPTGLFGIELPILVHGVMLSLSANVLAFVGLSLTRPMTPIERLQANLFVGSQRTPMGQTFRLWRGSVTAEELEATVARYLGVEATRRAFEGFRRSRGNEGDGTGDEADIHMLRFAEHLLASAIGAASSRLVLSLLLRRRTVSREAALKLIDDASAALQYNRDLLQQALDFARQGITVVDQDLRLICWNREFRELFDLPPDLMRVGMGLDEVVRYNAERGIYGPGPPDEYITARLELLVNEREPFRLRLRPLGNVVEIRSARMPEGGLVTTYTDITETVEAEEALAATNETLEQRVRERTEELVRLNGELARAKGQAEDANLSKTRFLAAASHDILQPLNAARLYATSLVEKMTETGEPVPGSDLATNLDASLEAVEEILTALLDISRLDAGAMKAEITNFRIDDVLNQLRIEFGPLAREKRLTLTFIPCSLSVSSDRRLLRRLLQNLISNAIKYTSAGQVLVGCRRRGKLIEVQVFDTGMGIPESKQKDVFREFERLAPAAKTARGLGLGLSIVERLSRVLHHRIRLKSGQGRGSMFSVEVPVAESSATSSPAVAEAPTAYAPLEGLAVVAIDNEPRILEGMQALLKGWGCSVVTGASLDEVMAVLQGAGITPDAVVADYHLDDTDGLAAIAGLRERYGAELPALLVTADRSPELRELAAGRGIRLLNKPVRPAALRSILSQWRVTKSAAE
jgi:Na+/proline symporter/signal transduction histidine kinase